MTETKRCLGCGRDLPRDAEHFGIDNDKPDGFRAQCKACRNHRDRTRSNEYIEAEIMGGGATLAAYGTPLQRSCAEALIRAGSIEAAAESLQLEPAQLRAYLSELCRIAARRGYAPNSDMTQTTPEGFHVKGTSTYYKIAEDGTKRPSGQWVKTKADEEHKLAAMLQAMSHVADAWQSKAEPVIAPVHFDEDLLAVYPMGDPHIGMFSWALETGDDFDLKIAERNMCDAVDQLVAGAPLAREALIVNLGDYFHADNQSNQTLRSGHALDVDSRWAKVLRVGIRTMRRCIDRALEKHERVRVICEIGNHDDHSSVMLALCLEQYYEREPRVTIDTSPAAFHWYRFGTTLIGVTHGHSVKLAQLPGIMACDRKSDWAETEYRYFYTGHVHHDSLHEFPGCIVETFRTLAPRDAWAAASGYRSGRDMKCVVIHRTDGEIQRNTVGISQLKRRNGTA